MNLFVAHKMTQNNALNNIHVAATDLPQRLSWNTNVYLERQPHTGAVGLCEAVKLSEK